MKTYRINLIACFIAAGSMGLLMSSCGNDEGGSDMESDMDSLGADVETQDVSQAQKVFYTLPSPFEVASMLKSAGAKFSPEVLNPVDNLSNYSTSKSKALNLGIYGADLSFVSMFEQTQESMQYMAVVKKLCEDLGISSAFSSATMERLEANKDNQDSVEQIVADAYLIANSYLKENEREDASAMILAGGWAEGLYIATHLINQDNPNEDLMLMVGEQKYSLENLIALLGSYQNGNVEDILQDMNALMEIYNKVEEVGQTDVQQTTNAEEKITVIGGGSEIQLNPETLKQITEKITEIRNSYIE
ncbi:MAG: hypothetical protein ACE5DN_02955 [Flavobacteriales bacterium]